jgi:hypothetical protein
VKAVLGLYELDDCRALPGPALPLALKALHFNKKEQVLSVAANDANQMMWCIH